MNIKTLVNSLILVGMTVVLPSTVGATPTGGTVVGGSAAISQSGNTTTINQASQNAVINWQSFNTNPAETVRFFQPNASSAALNRITNGLPTTFQGQLLANGRIFIINPNGVLFTNTSRIDVGSLFATTANINNSDFMNGNYHFQQAPNNFSSVINNGSIIARGDLSIGEQGLVALVAPGVQNNGVITANMGRVVLASGTSYTVDMYGDNLINFDVGAAVTQRPHDTEGNLLNELVSNNGQIYADGGKVILSARAAANVVDNVISMGGQIEAKSAAVGSNGVIILGGENGIVKVTGKINVAGKSSGQKGGTVKVLGQKVGLFDEASIDASGDVGGGEILIGGNYQGNGPEQNADATYVGPNTQLFADALTNGDGGRIIIWGTDSMRAYGSIFARGGSNGGNGGFIETSGHWIDVDNISVNTLAPFGEAGTWLIDPTDLTISSAANSNISGSTPFQPSPASSATSNLNVGTLQTALVSSSVVVTTVGSTGSGSGNITVSNAITAPNVSTITPIPRNLTLNAAGSIIINAAINMSQLNTTTAGGTTIVGGSFTATAVNDVTVNAAITTATSSGSSTNSTGVTTGSINLTATNGNITLNSGNLTTGNATATTTSAGTATGTTATSGNISLTAGGNILLNNATLTTGNATFTAADPDVNAASTSGNITLLAGGSVGSLPGSGRLITGNAGGTAINSLSNTHTGNISITANGGGIGLFVSAGLNSAVRTGSATSNWQNHVGNIVLTAAGEINNGTAGTGFKIRQGVPTDASGIAEFGDLRIVTTGPSGNAYIEMNPNVSENINFGGGNTSISGDFSISNSGGITQDNRISVGGTALFDVVGGDIVLTNTQNNFGGAVSFDTADNVSIQEFDSLVLGASIIGGNLGIGFGLLGSTHHTLSQTGALTVLGTTNIVISGSGATADILLGSFSNVLASLPTVSATVTKIRDFALRKSTSASFGATYFSAMTGLVDLTLQFDSGAMVLPNITTHSGGNLSVTTNNAAISQAASTNLVVPGTSFFSAGAGTITLNGSGSNNFIGAVSLNNSGNNAVSITDREDLILGTSTLGSGAFNINFGTGAIAAPSLTQTGVITTSGNTTISANPPIAGIANVLLHTQPNNFGGTISFSTTSAFRDLGIQNINATAGGGIVPNISGLNNLRDLTLIFPNSTFVTVPTLSTFSLLRHLTLNFGNNSMVMPTTTLHSGGNLSLTASGNISQTGAIVVPGTSSVTSTAGIINLNNASNNFTGGVALSTTGSNDATIRDLNALVLGNATGNVSIGGILSVIANGAISQFATSTITVGGASSFAAGANAITLANTGNDFIGGVALSNSGANTVSIQDINALVLGNATGNVSVGSNLSVIANGAISQFLGSTITVPGTSSFAAGANAITLANTGNSFTGAVSLSNSGTNDVSIVNSLALLLGNSSIGRNFSATAGGTTGGISISQVGGTTLVIGTTGTTTLGVTAVNADIILGNVGNDLGTSVLFTNGTPAFIEDVNLYNANTNPTVPTFTALTNLKDLTLNFANAAMTINSLITLTSGGSFNLIANNDVNINANLIAGNNVVASGHNTTVQGGNISVVSNTGNINGAVTLQTGNATLTDNIGGAGTNTVTSGSLTLSAPGTVSNLFSIILGNATLNGIGAANNIITSGSLALSNAGSASLTTGNATFNAVAGLAPSNNIISSGSINITGGAISGSGVFTTGSASLTGSVFAGSNTNINSGNVTVNAAGGISLSGNPALVTGAASDTTGTANVTSGNIALTAAGEINNGTASTPLRIRLGNATGGSSNNVGTLAVNTTGASGNAFIDTSVAATPVRLAASNISQIFNLLTAGNISQTGALIVGSNASFNAGANDITLTNAANNFGGVTSFANTGAHDVSVTDLNALTLGTSTIGRNLSLTVGGDLIQTGAITASAATTPISITVTNPTTNILLGTHANNFNQPITFVNPANVQDLSLRNTNAAAALPTNLTSLSNLNDLTLIFNNAGMNFPALTISGNLIANAGGLIQQSGALNVLGTSNFSTGGFNITLTNTANDFAGAVSLSNTGANDVSLTDVNALALGASNIGRNLSLTFGGDLTQTGAVIASSATNPISLTVTNSTTNVLLNTQNNNFNTSFSFVNPTNIQDFKLRNANAGATVPNFTTLTNLRDLTLNFTNAGMTIASLITLINGGSFDLTANGTVNINANLIAGNSVASGTNTTVQGGNISVVSNTGNINGSVTLQTGNANLTDNSDSSTGTDTVTAGNLTLSAPGTISNLFSIVLGNATLNGTGAATNNITSGNLSLSNAGSASLTTGSATFNSAASTTARNNTISSGNINISGGTISGTGLFTTGAAALTGSTHALSTTNINSGNIIVNASSGGISLPGNPALVTGAASDATGTANVTSGNIALTAAGEINNGTASTPLRIRLGNATGGLINNAGTLAVNTTGASGNAYIDTSSTTTPIRLATSNISQIFRLLTAGNISQTGALTVGGTSLFNSGANSINLTNSGNALTGAVTLFNSGVNDASITNSIALLFGNVSIGGNLTASGAVISQAAATTIDIANAGTTTLSVSSPNVDIILANTGNDLGTNIVLNTGTPSNIRDVNLDNANSGATVPTFTGLTNLRNLTLTFENAGMSFPALSISGNLIANAADAIQQTGALNIGGTSSFSTGASNIGLTIATNNFTGAVSLSNTGANDAAITDANALVIGTASIGRDLSISSNTLNFLGNTTVGGDLTTNTSGDVSQTGIISVAGDTIFSATGAGINIFLGTAANNFAGNISFIESAGTFNDIALRNVNAAASVLDFSTLTAGTLHDLTLIFDNAGMTFSALSITGNLVANANGLIQQSGALDIDGTSSFSAGANVITLTNAANDFAGAVSLSNTGANDVSLTDVNALVLGASNIGRNLSLTFGGNLTQTGAMNASSATNPISLTVTNPTTNISLDSLGNNFNTSFSFTNPANIQDFSLTNSNAGATVPNFTTLTALRNLTLNFTNAGMTIASFITLTGGGSFDLTANGNVNINANLIAGDSNQTTSGTGLSVQGGNISVTSNTGNINGSVSLTTGSATLNDAGSTGTNNVNSGSLTLSAPGTISNAFSITLGNATLNGIGANINNITSGDLSLSNNTPSSLTTGNAIFNNTNVSTGVNTITSGSINLSGNSITGSGVFTTGNAAISNNFAVGTSNINSGNIIVTTSSGGIGLSGNPALITGNASDATGTANVTSGNISLSAAGEINNGTLGNTLKVQLGNATGGFTNNAGTLSVNTTGASGNAYIDTTAAATPVRLAASNISQIFHLFTAGNITQTGALSVGGSSLFNAGGVSNLINLNTQNNDFTGAVAFNNVGDVSVRDANALSLAASTISGNLVVNSGFTSAGNLTQTGALIVGGTSDFNAGGTGNLINLNTQNNNFIGAVSFNNVGDVSVRDINALVLAASTIGGNLLVNSGVTGAGNLTQTGIISVGGTSSFNAGGVGNLINLNTENNDFTGAVAFNNVGDVSVRDISALDLAASTISGNLVVNSGATGAGDLTQTGILSVVGTSTFNAGATTNNINLNTQNNDFTGAVSFANVGDASIRDINALALGASTITGNLLVNSGVIGAGDLTQTGALSVTGTSTFNANANNIILTNIANDFTGAVSLSNTGANDVFINDANALTLGASSIGRNLAVTTTGNLTQNAALSVAGTSNINAGAADITLTNALNNFVGAVTLIANNASITDASALVLGNSVLNGDLALITSGNVTQIAELIVNGTSNINAGTADIILTNTLNNFIGAVALIANDASITDASALVLGNSVLGGSLAVIAFGNVTQTAPLSVTGTSNINAGAADITLTNALNNFVGAVALIANNASITDASALVLGNSLLGGNLTVTAAGDVSQTDVIAVANDTTFTTTDAGININLGTATNNFAGNVSFTESAGTFNDIALRNVNAAATVFDFSTLTAGTLNDLTLIFDNAGMSFSALNITGNLVANANGLIQQTGALNIAGTSNFSAGANAITLTNAANDFTGAVSLSNTGANNVSIVDSTALQFGNSSIGGDLTATAGGTGISQAAATTIDISNSGTTTLNVSAAGADIILGNAGNDLGAIIDLTTVGNPGNIRDVNLDTANAAATIPSLTGLTSLRNLTLTFENAAMNLPTLAISGNLVANANGNIQQSGILTIAGTSSFSAGTNNIILTNALNNFTGAVSLTSNNASITDVNALVLGNSVLSGNLNVTATGNITQTAQVSVTGTSLFNAGANDITLDNLLNHFVGAISIHNPLLLSGANNAVLANDTHTIMGITRITNDLTLTSAGTITQIDTIHSQDLTLFANGGINLSLANAPTSLSATNVGGDFIFNNLDALTINNISQTGGGNILVTNADTITIPNTSNITTDGGNITIFSSFVSAAPVILVQGNIDSGAGIGGSLTIGAGVQLNAAPTVGAGDITLNAPNGGNTFINTPILSANDITFTAPTVLQQDIIFNNNSGGTTTFLDTLDGAFGMLINGNAVFEGNIGDNTPLSTIHVTGTTDHNAASVTTTGTQTYDGAVTLTTNPILHGTDITFGSTIDASQLAPLNEGLVINNSGNATFNGAIGDIRPLAFLIVNGTSTINGGEVHTNGPGGQTYNGHVTLGDDTLLTGGNAGPLHINDGISGPTHTLTAIQFTNISVPNNGGGVVTQSLTLGGGSGTLFGTINGQPGQGSLPFITLIFGSGPFTFNGFPLVAVPPTPPINQNTIPPSVSTNPWDAQQNQYNSDYLNIFNPFWGLYDWFGDLDSLFLDEDEDLTICVQTTAKKGGQKCVKASKQKKVDKKAP